MYVVYSYSLTREQSSPEDQEKTFQEIKKISGEDSQQLPRECFSFEHITLGEDSVEDDVGLFLRNYQRRGSVSSSCDSSSSVIEVDPEVVKRNGAKDIREHQIAEEEHSTGKHL